MEAIGGTPQDFAKYLQAESEKWAKMVEAAHLQMPNGPRVGGLHLPNLSGRR
jgi:hypothetical protein